MKWRLYIVNLSRRCRRLSFLISAGVREVFGIESRILEMEGVRAEHIARRFEAGTFEDMISFLIIAPYEGFAYFKRGVLLGMGDIDCDDERLAGMAPSVFYHVGRAIGLGNCESVGCLMNYGSGTRLCDGCSNRLRVILSQTTNQGEGVGYPQDRDR